MPSSPPPNPARERLEPDARSPLGRVALPVVLMTWAAMTIAACSFIARYTDAVPIGDDLEYCSVLAGSQSMPWAFYWMPANEHRVVLPRLFLVGLLHVFGDIRAGMYFQIALQSMLALGLILFARKLRGRASVVDALFPLLLLHWGNPDNLLLGMAIATPLTPMLACGFMLFAFLRPGPPSPLRALGMVLCVACMPFNGGFGLMLMPPLILWCLAAGLVLLRDHESRSRVTAGVLIAGSVIAASLIVLYFTDFTFPAGRRRTHDPLLILRTMYQFQGLELGALSELAPHASAAISLALTLPGIWWLARAWKRGPAERWRASAMIAVLLASLSLAASIGISRALDSEVAGIANRYMHLPSPIWIGCFLASCVYAPRGLATALQTGMLATQLCVLPTNLARGTSGGTDRLQITSRLQADADADMPIDQLGQIYSDTVYPGAKQLAARLRILRRGGYPPFHPQPKHVGASSETRRVSINAPHGQQTRIVYHQEVLAVRGDAEVVYSVPKGARSVEIWFGMLPDTWRLPGAQSDGMRFEVVLRGPNGIESRLYQRELRPVKSVDDRGWQRKDVVLPEGAEGALCLRTRSLGTLETSYDWGFWSEIEVR